MARRRTDRAAMNRAQYDLLEWTPPAPVTAFEPRAVRSTSLSGHLARAVSTALHDSPDSREEIAERMSAFLGKRVTKHALDGFAAQSREEHVISTERFVALLHATGDRRLLELLAAPMGWVVIERRFLPLIELAAVREREDELRRQADALRRQARIGGLL